MALAVGLVLGSSPLPASAVTTEQLLFLEAWRSVDRAYVDKGFNGQSWFRVGYGSTTHGMLSCCAAVCASYTHVLA